MNSDPLSGENLFAELKVIKLQNEKLCKQLSEMTELLNKYRSEAEKYHNVFSGALDLIMIIDGVSGKIIDINDACISFLGYKPSELIGSHYSSIIHSINENKEAITPDQINMFGPILSSKYVRKADGTISPMDLTLNVINWNGTKAVQTTFRDAEERKNAGEEVKNYLEKLQALNKSKDKFFSVLAHDLRSPFTGLLGLSQILIEDIDEISKNDLLQYLSEINITIKSVYQLLNNLLEWACINSGDMQYNPEVINPDEKIKDVIQLLSMNATFKKIEIDFATDGVKHLYADSNMFKSVIQNLISNSIKFTNKSGNISINTYQREENIIIEIADTGIGINEENIGKIFNSDEAFSTRGTQGENGSGLGLALCRELVKRNNGVISLRSKVNVGTTFTLKFPVK